MPQARHDLPPHLRPVDPPRPEVRELPLPAEPPPAQPYLPEMEAPRPQDPFLRQS